MNYYAVLPANVRYNKKLSASVKLFYAELTSFADKQGKVNYNQTHFESLFKKDVRTIRRWVDDLKREGLVYVEKKQLFLNLSPSSYNTATTKLTPEDLTREKACVQYWKDLWGGAHVNEKRAIPFLTVLLEEFSEDQIKKAMRTRKHIVDNDAWFDSKPSIVATKKDIFAVLKNMTNLLNASDSITPTKTDLKPLY